MSRIGNKTIALPEKVKVNVGNDGAVAVEGPKGQTKLEVTTRDFGEGREQSCLAGAGGGNAERESVAWAFARSDQQHGARGE